MTELRPQRFARTLFGAILCAACSSADIDSATAQGGNDAAGGSSVAAGPAASGTGGGAAGGASAPLCEKPTPYATQVVSFSPGLNAGFGEDDPKVVLGPPRDGSPDRGSLHVLSLGVGGEIVLSFGEDVIFDGPGPDFVVWENPFWIGGNQQAPYAELGEIAVSNDLETWHTFACDSTATMPYDVGCAGWRPMVPFDVCGMQPLDPTKTGGDAFDLADLDVKQARYIRIRDLAKNGLPPSAGFDLDAVGGVHLTKARSE